MTNSAQQQLGSPAGRQQWRRQAASRLLRPPADYISISSRRVADSLTHWPPLRRLSEPPGASSPTGSGAKQLSATLQAWPRCAANRWPEIGRKPDNGGLAAANWILSRPKTGGRI